MKKIGKFLDTMRERKCAVLTESQYYDYLEMPRESHRMWYPPLWFMLSDTVDGTVDVDELEYLIIARINTAVGDDVILFVIPDIMTKEQKRLVDKLEQSLTTAREETGEGVFGRKMEAGKTQIGTIEIKNSDGTSSTYRVYFGNVLRPMMPDGKQGHLVKSAYEEMKMSFLDSEQGRKYVVPTYPEDIAACMEVLDDKSQE